MSKRKYVPLNFSPADDRTLMRLVKRNEMSWNGGDRDHKMGNKNDELWIEIADKLQKTGMHSYFRILYFLNSNKK